MRPTTGWEPDDSQLREAAQLEQLGYSTIWIPGGQIDKLDRLIRGRPGRHTTTAVALLGEHSTLVVDQLVVLHSDAQRARETARGSLRFLSKVGGYVANFRRMGFTTDDIESLSDRLVDGLVAGGDAAAVVERVTAHLAAGADHVVLGVLNEGGQPSSVEAGRALADRLRAAGVMAAERPLMTRAS